MKLINTNTYLLLIEEEAEINLADFITDEYNVWRWKDDSSLLGRKKVLAYYPLIKEAKEFDLPLLPPFEEDDIRKIAEKYAWNCKNEFTTKLKSNELVKASTRDFIAGYKAAQPKQFSLEDMKKAIRMARTLFEENMFDIKEILGLTEVCTHDMSLKYSEEEIIQSLSTQQLPKEFKPIMVCGRCLKPDDNDEDCWSAKECSRNTDFPDTFKTITNSEGKEELIGIYKY